MGQNEYKISEFPSNNISIFHSPKSAKKKRKKKKKNLYFFIDFFVGIFFSLFLTNLRFDFHPVGLADDELKQLDS